MITLKFKSKLWLYPGPGGWHFVTLPAKQAKTLRELPRETKQGWGSMPVWAAIGKTRWKTSVFPDRKSNSYVLPVKADVRKKEKLRESDTVLLTLELKV